MDMLTNAGPWDVEVRSVGLGDASTWADDHNFDRSSRFHRPPFSHFSADASLLTALLLLVPCHSRPAVQLSARRIATMSGFNDETVTQKLLALNESQDSIVTVAQWLMFHRRQATRTAELWIQRIRDPSTNAAKRLNLLYLANEVVQQSKAKRKDDILNAFAPLVADGMIAAYKGAPADIQNKLKRVSEVWRQRQVFHLPTQEGIERQIMGTDNLSEARDLSTCLTLCTEIDKSQPRSSRKALGGSLFPTDGAGSTPSELQPLVQLQQSLSKASLAVRPALDPANKAYTALTSGDTPLPSPPLYAARLSSLAKDLAKAEQAVTATLNTRRELITSLEKLLQSNRTALVEEQKQQESLHERRAEVETKKSDVEDAIMRGLSSTEGLNDGSHADLMLGERPEIERFTPPPASPLSDTTELPPKAQAQAQAQAQTQPDTIPRSTTPPGLPPSYTYTNGPQAPSPSSMAAADAFLNNLNPTGPPTVDAEVEDDLYAYASAAPSAETFTPPPAPTPNAGPDEPVDYSYLASAAAAAGVVPPGLSAPSANGADPRKRPASALAGADPRRRPTPMSNGAASATVSGLGAGGSASPAKRRRTSEKEEDFSKLPGLGGEGGLGGLDPEVVGLLG